MSPQPVRLFVPFSTDAPWIVRHEATRVGTYASRHEAISAALAMRAKLTRAWSCSQPPVRVQARDGNWHEVHSTEADRAA